MKKIKYFLLIFFSYFYVNTYSFANPNTDQLLQQANQGDAKAQFAIGDLYYTGKLGPKNDKKALEYYQNYAYAYISIGYLYSQGEGVPQNTLTAIKWFKKGSDVGDTGAQMALASIYLEGKDTPKDIEKSKLYIQKACMNKLQQACNLLKSLDRK